MSELYNGGVYRGGNLSYYYMNLQYMSLLMRYFSPDQTFTYNSVSNRLKIQDIKFVKCTYGFVVFQAYVRLDPDMADSNTDMVGEVYNDRWVKAYSTALIKKQWGENIDKFSEVAMIGGVKMSGTKLIEKADAEIEKLETELYTRYQHPIQIFMG